MTDAPKQRSNADQSNEDHGSWDEDPAAEPLQVTLTDDAADPPQTPLSTSFTEGEEILPDEEEPPLPGGPPQAT